MNNRPIKNPLDRYATTEPTAITPVEKAPVKKHDLKLAELMATIEALRKEIIDSMEARDAQVEALSLQRESIVDLRGQIAKLRKINDRMGDEFTTEISKATKEIDALKTLVKLYI